MRIERYRNITVFTALLALFLGTETPAHAVETGQVAYYGGTVPGMPRGALGALHTDFPATLVFQTTAQTSPAEVDISYDKIRSVKYSTEVTHHLGVLPAIAVGLIRKRSAGTSSRSVLRTHPVRYRPCSSRSRRMTRRYCCKSCGPGQPSARTKRPPAPPMASRKYPCPRQELNEKGRGDDSSPRPDSCS